MTPRKLWEIKTGLHPDPDETPAMARGKYLEDLVADLYVEKTGRRLWRSRRTMVHPAHDFMLAHIDRQIVAEDERGPGVLEIKCPGLRIFSECKRQGLPSHYAVQLQHYLAVSDRKWGAFAVFNAERWEMIFFDVNRDDELIDIIIARDAEFWQAVVEGRPVEEEAPALELPPAEPSEIVTMDSPAWANAVERLREAREILREAAVLEADAEAALKKIMESSGAAVAEGAGARIYFRLQDGRESFDLKRFRKDHPELELAGYMKRGNPFKTFRPYFIERTLNHE
jgi:putative phage-type endonuclease